MDDKRMVKVSKYLSRHLRHDPGRIGIELDEHGWVDVDVLLKALADRNFQVTREELEEVVARNDKQRFALRDGRIRANQGHTVDVDLDLSPVAPPPVLYHGTAGGFVATIRDEGLKPMDRHHVHLSPDRETAIKVGSRRGKPVVLAIDARRMAGEGYTFYKSENGVWLTEYVPAWAIMFPG
ncbi:RNA 2'-phosphotransferase [Glycomyces niveus]|uniref:Probable RNA 2'-phosphotransferase n=1 Tax=Glycomyces niveus TaxID=2820287 RepID=A0ABS3TYS4_9ACTN|nr:RNA 2'-phosphotransferase [Glycomyces sp. NEAU-S30]MBO3731654.1 RNA 2'-phosphotransferase [Glycomyces sp. NEAU-S30]